jgi:hypothetical protein
MLKLLVICGMKGFGAEHTALPTEKPLWIDLTGAPWTVFEASFSVGGYVIFEQVS